jgi:hypothetical protein
MSPPERTHRVALRLALCLIGAYALWFGLAQLPALDSLWVLAELVWPKLFHGGLLRIDPLDVGWRIHSGWLPAAGPDERGGALILLIDQSALKRIVSGFPLLLALLLATRKPTPKRVLLGLSVLWIISWLAITSYAWHRLAIASGLHTSFVDPSFSPPPFRLAMQAYPTWEVYLSGYLMYLAVLVVPFIAPIVIWAALCHAHLRSTMQDLQQRYRQQSLDRPRS